ncbi:MAG: hypothetical protein M1114_02255 [Candidatus Dependentiae bacterium]|nr:hypothetical protein [Candidatus Dependentiae bacterium]
MNIKAPVFSVLLSLAIGTHISSMAKNISPHVEPEQGTLEWLDWCLQHSSQGINHPELLYNRASYVYLVREHLRGLQEKIILCNRLSEYKYNKGFIETEWGITTALIAYAAYCLCRARDIDINYTDFVPLAFSLASCALFAEGINNINKSYTYEDDIKRKIEYSTYLLRILNP